MTSSFPGSLPEPHRKFLASSMDVLQSDPRIVGMAAGGSYLTDSMDEFSDLDLVVAVEPAANEAVLNERLAIADRLGTLLVGFTGEHVGEPRLLICLYDDNPPLHVDLKFVTLPDIATRIEDPAVLWEREGRLTQYLNEGASEYPPPNLQWIEDRFWVWVHYVAAKIGRGELFEGMECLSYLRVTVLGPLLLHRSGRRPAGVRRLEQLLPESAHALESTVAGHSAADCVRALHACVEMYRTLRVGVPGLECRRAAEEAAMKYLSDTEKTCNQSEPM